MRCEHCQTEVAAQVAEDGSIICGSCGGVIDTHQAPQLDEQLRQAEELLERWSKEPLLEPFEPLPGKEASHLSESEQIQPHSESDEPEQTADPPQENHDARQETPGSDAETDPHSGESEEHAEIPQEFEGAGPQDPPPPEPPASGFAGENPSKPVFRFDAAHVTPEAETEDQEQPAESDQSDELSSASPEPVDFDALDAAEAEAVNESSGSTDDIDDNESSSVSDPEPATPSNFHPHRVDSAQTAAVHSPPHLDIQQLIDQRLQEQQQGFNWMVFAGQWLSYLGVLGLTAGAALIVYGYFGGSAEMVPKGWMLTTAGQMLLLLGIVTLISGGLDQANSEVNTRIQVLGEQMLRFERETREHFLRGPKIPANQFAENAPPAEQTKTADQTSDS